MSGHRPPRDDEVYLETLRQLRALLDDEPQDARDYLALQERCDQWCMRAEAAEAKLTALTKQLNEAERLWERDRATLVQATAAAQRFWKRTGEAEARLAECVREVRQWAEQHEIGEAFEAFEDDHLEAILAKYEARS